LDKSLIVFLKNPVEGKVKTRIANTAGNIKALEIYRELLGILNDNLARVNCEVYLYFTETPMEISYWANANYIYRVQKGNDLGARMSAAFEEVFRDGGSQKPLKVLIVGSDCPLLSAEIIDEAFLKLDKSDIVLGPAEDGGYYLLGMKKMNTELFEGVSWSTEKVLNETLDKAAGLGLSVAFTPSLFDIDTEEDWTRWLKLVKR
jgi:rSAM/selenodomain-associated transferase 1